MKMDIVDLSVDSSVDSSDQVDQLDEIFKLQSELQRKLGFDFSTMTMDEKIEFLRWNALALTSELSEGMAEVGWKPWASARYIDREPFAGEMIDVSKFLLNMMLVVDMTPSEFVQRFRGKTVVNHQRADDGYDGVSTKCACGRALDEPTITS